MHALLRDLRHGLRLLRQDAGFAVIAILTLALGIGANTAIFSVVDAVLLRPLPFPHSEQLVSIRESSRSFPSMSVAYPDYLDWAKQNHVFSSVAAFQWDGYNLTGVGEPAAIQAGAVSASYFPTLGVAPLIGRTFSPAEDSAGAGATVVLSYKLWQQRFGGDRRWLGRAITLDGQSYTVIGVMPASFSGAFSQFAGNDVQLWVPLGRKAGLAANKYLMSRGNHPGINDLARLKPGMTLAQARADMETIARRLDRQYPDSNTGEGVNLLSLKERAVGNTRPALLALLAAVGFVLLIACANVANLQLARAATRRKEFAIRAALGASRGRLVRHMLTESVALACLGGLLGLGLAGALIALAPKIIPASVPRTAQLALDWRVLLFTLAISLATGVLFGLAPAAHGPERDLQGELKEGGRSSRAGLTGQRVRAALVVAEAALSLVLLLGAGLLLRSFWRLSHVNPGFDARGVLTFSISLPPSRYPKDPQIVSLFRRAVERMSHLPGVSAAGAIMPLPLGGSDWENSFQLPDRPKFPPGQTPSTDFAMVTSDYFRSMRIPLLRGRYFTDADDAQAPKVAIVDRGFADKYWPGRDPIGQRIAMAKDVLSIVGVVPHVELEDLSGASVVDKLPEMYVPQAQHAIHDMTFVLRAAPGLADPANLTSAAKAAISALDPDLPVYDIKTLSSIISNSLGNSRLSLILIGLFALLALVLAAVGIYGVMSYMVTQQAHDIGIRMALGAQRGDVLGLVLRQGLRLAVPGLVLGLAAALALGRLLAGFLFGVRPTDPATFVAIALLLLAVALVACYLPARRATGVDPLVALRYE
ncbi:MAG: ABC transporter permease [Terriglobales bacterium]